MITGIAFCPQAPALVPAVGRGLGGELGVLRAACRMAIRRVAPPSSQIVVIGSGRQNATFATSSRGSLAPYGVDLVVGLGSDDGPIALPPSLTVGAWLVRDAVGPCSGAVAHSVGPDASDLPQIADGDSTALVVVGDGSARRSEKAPGYLDDRAAAFDARVAEALRAGNAPGLRHELSWPGGDEMLAAGVRVWDEVARLVEAANWDGELLYDHAPYGVGYFVATWTLRA